MAHFYGTMKGARGATSRTGTKNSGMTAHIRGWGVGAEVTVHVDSMGKDVVTVYRTGGSHDSTRRAIVASFTSNPEPSQELVGQMLKKAYG